MVIKYLIGIPNVIKIIEPELDTIAAHLKLTSSNEEGGTIFIFLFLYSTGML